MGFRKDWNWVFVRPCFYCRWKRMPCGFWYQQSSGGVVNSAGSAYCSGYLFIFQSTEDEATKGQPNKTLILKQYYADEIKFLINPICLIAFFLLLTNSCKKADNTIILISPDRLGRWLILIGNISQPIPLQSTWMAKNLNVTKFNDGSLFNCNVRFFMVQFYTPDIVV